MEALWAVVRECRERGVVHHPAVLEHALLDRTLDRGQGRVPKERSDAGCVIAYWFMACVAMYCLVFVEEYDGHGAKSCRIVAEAGFVQLLELEP